MQQCSLAEEYHDRGWVVLSLPHRSKRPTAEGWQNTAVDDFDPSHFTGPCNIGVLLGEASGGLVDVDLDCSESLMLAPMFLPQTQAVFGRAGKRRSHWLYIVAKPEGTARLKDVAKDREGKQPTLVELRSTGGQTVFPGSVHETGEPIQWEQDGDRPTLVEWGDLLTCVRHLGAAALLVRHWPGLGAKHDARVALCGALLRSGWEPGVVETFVRSVCTVAGDRDLDDVGNSIRTTIQRLRNEGKATGWPRLASMLSDGEEVVRHVREWLGLISLDVEELEPADDEELIAPPFPTRLLTPPGKIGVLCNWINDTAIKPQPVFALANALAAWGVVVGRIVRCKRSRTNLYCLGVGESGCGKDHSRQAIKRLFEYSGQIAMIGGEDIASDAALLRAVVDQPAILFQIDEIGHFFANASSKYAGSHMKQIAPTFTRLFSSANGVLPGKQYASGDRKDIDQPCVGLYGTTVPDRLYGGLSQDEVTDGFLARMLVFRTRDVDPMEDLRADFDAPPDELVEAVVRWRTRTDLPKPDGNIARAVRHLPIDVPLDPDALAAFAGLASRVRGAKEMHRGNQGIDALWARAPEHAQKVALTCATAVAFDLEFLRVTGEVARWACDLVQFVIDDFVRDIEGNVSSSDFERDVQSVLRVIRKAGSGGISKSRLYRLTSRIDPRRRDAVLIHLKETRQVGERIGPKPLRGTAPTFYYAAREK